MKFATKVFKIFALAVLLPSLAFAQYTRTDLVTNLGVNGTVADPNLVNQNVYSRCDGVVVEKFPDFGKKS